MEDTDPRAIGVPNNQGALAGLPPSGSSKPMFSRLDPLRPESGLCPGNEVISLALVEIDFPTSAGSTHHRVVELNHRFGPPRARRLRLGDQVVHGTTRPRTVFHRPGETNALGRAVAAMSDEDCARLAQEIREWLRVVETRAEQDESPHDATLAGPTATAEASGLPGQVVAEAVTGIAASFPRLSASVSVTATPPRVIGDETVAGWADLLPPGMPALVRTSAARQQAIDGLRRIADGLLTALPEATGVEKRMIELVVFHSIDEIIDCLQLITPEQTPAAEAVQRSEQAVRKLVLATKILDGFEAWATAVLWIHKALALLGYA